jgi:hypothetical protein
MFSYQKSLPKIWKIEFKQFFKKKIINFSRQFFFKLINCLGDNFVVIIVFKITITPRHNKIQFHLQITHSFFTPRKCDPPNESPIATKFDGMKNLSKNHVEECSLKLIIQRVSKMRGRLKIKKSLSNRPFKIALWPKSSFRFKVRNVNYGEMQFCAIFKIFNKNVWKFLRKFGKYF